MTRYSSKSIAVILLLGCVFALSAQRRARNANHVTITARSNELLSSVAARANVSADELARANDLPVDTRLRRGQRLLLPSASPDAITVQPSGEVVGKRIIFVDGGSLDADDAWRQGDVTWYRLNGVSQSSTRPVRLIQDRYKEKSVALLPKPETVKKVVSAPPVTWIYLADGARLRVDEVREVADGAWYNRGNLSIFLAKERIARIERVDPDAESGDWKQHGWSSGNTLIDQLIRTNATRVGIDPYLVFLVIEQESHFRTRIISPKGAQGLMQLMPGTARRYGVSRPFDAGENIRGGTQYLKELLSMFKGRVDLALASYNAGEGRVLDYGNRVPPFKETQNYVKRISSRYRDHAPNEK